MASEQVFNFSKAATCAYSSSAPSPYNSQNNFKAMSAMCIE